MKVYSIGREIGCDIIIDDNTDIISRRHAVLNVSPSGKMTIIDQSQNGTYVNGIRISSNVPVPVTRKDNVSFAHVAPLNWDRIPNQRAMIVRYAAIAIVALLVVIGGVAWFNSNGGGTGGNPQPAPVDTTAMKKNSEELKKREKEVADSLKKKAQDSIQNANKKKANTKKSDNKKPAEKKDTKKKETPKKSEEEPKPGLRV
ncbi:MAG: FHA domain-containing protein [Prevotella sp.]